MMIYRIERLADGTVRAQYGPEGSRLDHFFNDLPHVCLHSPTGFETGYGGSGPADLAVSILVHHFGKSPADVEREWRGGLTRQRRSRALDLHQPFKRDFISGNAIGVGESYEITSNQIEDWLINGEQPERIHLPRDAA